MNAGRIVLLILGCVVALIALAQLAGGGVLLWAHTTQRDDDGFYSTRHEMFRSDGYAVRSDDLDAGTEGLNWAFEEGRLGTIRLEGRSAEPGKQLFLGIATADQIARYLSDVPHDVATDFDLDPFRVTYRSAGGSRAPPRPEAQNFWAASGIGRIEWDVDEGDWAAVAMNADGSRGVVAEISVAAKTRLVLWAALILLGLGLVFGAVAALLIALAVRDRAVPAAPPERAAAAALAAGAYPVQLDAELEDGLSRWLWLVKWLLLIPHVLVLIFLWAAFVVVTVIAFFAILFTERYPRGLFDFNLAVLRWIWRVSWYGYGGLGTDRYPPFTLQDVDYPARLDVPYPERLSRWLVLVKWWLLAIPHYLVISFFLGPGWWWSDAYGHVRYGPGLIFLLVIFAAVVLLVRNRYPRSLYDLVLGMDRWVVRVVAYAALMRDEYPPFRLGR
jgi:hypothetical protein